MKIGLPEKFMICVLPFLFLPAPAAAKPATAFEPGERLEYVLKWSGIAAGDSVMEIVKGEWIDGAHLYKVISTAESRSLVDVIYKVRNHYETHIHPIDGLTRKYVFDMKEGKKKQRRILFFDQNNLTVRRVLVKKSGDQTMVYDIPPQTQDNLSALYALRNEHLEVGDVFDYLVFENKKNWELIIEVIAQEDIEVKAGRFRALVVHPKLKFEGIFRRKGELHVYMTDDQWHIPILMKSKVKIGNIDAELVRFKLGGEEKTIPSMLPPKKDKLPPEEDD